METKKRFFHSRGRETKFFLFLSFLADATEGEGWVLWSGVFKEGGWLAGWGWRTGRRKGLEISCSGGKKEGKRGKLAERVFSPPFFPPCFCVPRWLGGRGLVY